jgi:uncharacterized protein (TIGR02588 family)
VEPRNWVEWAIVALSAGAVAAIVGFLVLDAAMDSGGPPAPVVRLHPERAYEIPNGWMLPATAANKGDRAAEALLLVAAATVEGKTEEAEVTVDYLPGGSQVQVTFGFSAEPEGDIDVRVSGFIR